MKIIKKGYTYKHEVVTETFYEEERDQKKDTEEIDIRICLRKINTKSRRIWKKLT